jgi:hypothetical protein
VALLRERWGANILSYLQKIGFPRRGGGCQSEPRLESYRTIICPCRAEDTFAAKQAFIHDCIPLRACSVKDDVHRVYHGWGVHVLSHESSTLPSYWNAFSYRKPTGSCYLGSWKLLYFVQTNTWVTGTAAHLGYFPEHRTLRVETGNSEGSWQPHLRSLSRLAPLFIHDHFRSFWMWTSTRQTRTYLRANVHGYRRIIIMNPTVAFRSPSTFPSARIELRCSCHVCSYRQCLSSTAAILNLIQLFETTGLKRSSSNLSTSWTVHRQCLPAGNSQESYKRKCLGNKHHPQSGDQTKSALVPESTVARWSYSKTYFLGSFLYARCWEQRFDDEKGCSIDAKLCWPAGWVDVHHIWLRHYLIGCYRVPWFSKQWVLSMQLSMEKRQEDVGLLDRWARPHCISRTRTVVVILPYNLVLLPISFVHQPLVLHQADLSLCKGMVISKRRAKGSKGHDGYEQKSYGASTE